ncbi:MAG: hypothetical protein GXP32_05910 [Kiritimatiellaeota bacterium]|nr:hypothetical protein [Kiritimatiellota bacterium]
MKTAMLIALCAAAATFAGCKKESQEDQAAKKVERQTNYVQKQAEKYTRSITGGQKRIEKQREKSEK